MSLSCITSPYLWQSDISSRIAFLRLYTSFYVCGIKLKDTTQCTCVEDLVRARIKRHGDRACSNIFPSFPVSFLSVWSLISFEIPVSIRTSETWYLICRPGNVSWWLEAPAAKYMRTALFWVITQQVVVMTYRRFGTTCGSHPQVSRIFSSKGTINWNIKTPP